MSKAGNREAPSVTLRGLRHVYPKRLAGAQPKCRPP